MKFVKKRMEWNTFPLNHPLGSSVVDVLESDSSIASTAARRLIIAVRVEATVRRSSQVSLRPCWHPTQHNDMQSQGGLDA